MPHNDWAANKIYFSRTSKMPVSSFCEYIFLKKINIGKKNKQSMVVPFKEIQLYKGEETLLTFNNLRPVMML